MWKTLFGLALGRRLPTVDGTLAIAGTDGPITLRRDAHGVAYIEATTDADAFFGLGFAQAQDRGFQVELLVRVVHGTLAEVVGPEMLDVDRLSRRIGFPGIAAAQLAVAEPAIVAQITAFARGINAAHAHGRRPHEMVLLGIQPTPFAPADTLAVFQFLAFALSSNWDAELARLRVLRADGPEAVLALEASLRRWREDVLGADRLVASLDLLAAAESLTAGAEGLQRLGMGGASNNWALAPSRTATGRPLLAGDPHLSPTLPAPWYLAHVRTPEWAFSGACFITQPVVSIGHNDRCAWAVTAGHADNTDLFVEQVDGDRVRDGDGWVPCEVREERIRVKGAADVVERVLVTPRGPIVGPALGESRDALSMRGTWMAARPIGGYRSYRARSAREFLASFASYPGISENRVAADVDGHIAWKLVGDLPVRRSGRGLLPTPGWDPEAGWEPEPRPFAEHPSLVDPECGFVASANQAPPGYTGEPFLGADWLDGYRYDRIAEQLGARSDWTVERCQALQVDRFSRLWPEVREAVLGAAGASGESADLQEARRLLEGWDGVVAPESTAASVFELAIADLACRIARAKAPNAWQAALGLGINEVLPHGTMPLRRLAHVSGLLRDQPEGFFPGGWPAEIRASLETAVRTLRAKHGRESWAWGKVRPLHLLHPVAAQAPLNRIFALPPIAAGGDATTVAQASLDFQDPLGNPFGIANLRAVMDVGAWENCRFSLAGGQSGNPLSPHFGDLLPVWEKGEGIAIAWSPEEVQRRAVATLRIMPA